MIVDRACTVTDPTAGEVTAAWQTGDTSNYGNGVAQFKVTWSDGVESFPNTRYLDISITPGLA